MKTFKIYYVAYGYYEATAETEEEALEMYESADLAGDGHVETVNIQNIVEED